jgi:hypothetical protein
VGWNLPGRDPYSGFGRVNLYNALEKVPLVRTVIEWPQENEIIGGLAEITGIADGAEFSGYTLDYGEGDIPDSWVPITASDVAVTNDILFPWNTGDLNGRYTIRLKAGDYNMSTNTVFIINDTAAQIFSPGDDITAADFIAIKGEAYCPSFRYTLVEYSADSNPSQWIQIARVSVPVFGDEITGWYLEDIQEGRYNLRLSLYDKSGLVAQDTTAVNVQSIFSTENAWKTVMDGYPTIVPTYGDFDGDGQNEIIIGTSSGIKAFNPDGSPKTEGLPDFPVNNFMIPIAVGRLDSDSIDDLVAMGYDPPKVYGYPSGGEPFEAYLGIFPPVGNFFLTEHEFPRIFLKDIDGDGLDEIHAFVYNGTMSKTFLFDSDGKPINTFNYYQEYLPADLNGDGIDEIYACNRGFCLLRQIDYNTGLTVDSLLIQINGSNFTAMGMLAYDIDGDRKLELIMYGFFDDLGYWIYAFDEGLNIVDGWPHDMQIDDFVVPTVPIFGDINGDGVPEYFTGFFDISASYVIAYNLDGTPYFPGANGLFAVTPEPSVLNMLILGDINGDNNVDVIAYADNDMFDTYPYQRIYAWDNEGRLLSGFPLITSTDVFTSNRFTPSLGDIDKDGNVDIIATTPDSAVIFVNFPGCHYSENNSPAPFWRYNRRLNNTGPLPPDTTSTEVVESQDLAQPSAFTLGQNYPNPFNPATAIDYALPHRAHVTISIYDILGRKIRTLVDQSGAAGRHVAIWDGRAGNGEAVSSGVYFYRIQAGEFSETKKMVLVR